jgi:hypothetical protein
MHPGMVGTGRMHRLIPVAALALAGGTQDRCRGKSLAMAPTTQRTIVVGSSTCGHEPSDPEAGWAMTPAGVVG